VVTKVLNDLLLAADRGQMSALCLLDMSAAFELLLQRLEHQFGLYVRVLQWIRSYLTDRTFHVVYGEGTSFVVQVMCSVPQGSVLGPLFFIVYMVDLEDLVVKYGLCLHTYADDTQLCFHFYRSELTFSLSDVCRTLATGCQPTD